MSLVVEEHNKIKSEINQLKRLLQESKDRIYRAYTLNRQSLAAVNMSDESLSPKKSKASPNLELSFYSQIIKIKCKEDDSLITILFPIKSEYRFGFNLIKTVHGKWSLDKYQLPHTIDLDHFKTEISQLSLLQISENVEQIQRNVNTYYIREENVKQLREIMDSRIRLYHCLRYTELELTFKVFNKETKIRRSLTVQLNFGLFSVEAAEVICKINGSEEDEEMENFFNQHFAIFTRMDLIAAYNEAFQNVDKYKFFV